MQLALSTPAHTSREPQTEKANLTSRHQTDVFSYMLAYFGKNRTFWTIQSLQMDSEEVDYAA